MKLLAFAASNSSQSINKQLVTYASSLIEGAEVEILDINEYEMPLYSSDRENSSGIPELAHKFKRKITSADALLISFAEHNGTYTAAYKNLFDWTSRIDMKVYQGKAVVLLAASPGNGGAKNVLASAVASAPHFEGEVKASLSIPSFYNNFDVETGKISNPELNEELLVAVNKLNDQTEN